MRIFQIVAMPILGKLILASACLAQDAPLPDGPAKSKVVAACSVCHAISQVTSQRRTAPEWADTVDEMIARGAQVPHDDYAEIVAYLGKNFAPSSTPDAATPAAKPSR